MCWQCQKSSSNSVTVGANLQSYYQIFYLAREKNSSLFIPNINGPQLKRLARDKRSILFVLFVSDEVKCFIRLAPGLDRQPCSGFQPHCPLTNAAHIPVKINKYILSCRIFCSFGNSALEKLEFRLYPPLSYFDHLVSKVLAPSPVTDPGSGWTRTGLEHVSFIWTQLYEEFLTSCHEQILVLLWFTVKQCLYIERV